MNNNFLDGIIIADLEEQLRGVLDAATATTQDRMCLHNVSKSLVIIVQGEDLNGKWGVADADDFHWNPFGADHYKTTTNDEKTLTEVILRLEWFEFLDIEDGIETAVKFALKELGIHNPQQISEGIADTVFAAWKRNPDIHSDIKLRFDFVEL